MPNQRYRPLKDNFNFPGQTILSKRGSNELYQESFSIAEFASRWKQAFSPDSIAQGKATARSTAIDKRGVAKGIFPMNQAYKDLESRVNTGSKLAAKGRQSMLTKAASPNRTMKPTTQRGILKVARPSKALSSKSAQSFKQGAQNQATNRANAVTAKLQDRTDKLTGQGKYKVPFTTPTLNPFEQSSWEKNASKGIKMKPVDVSNRLGSISTKKPGLLSKIGSAIRRNPVAAGAGLGAVGYGAYRKMRSDKNIR
jgi:hypothetical protein